MHDINQIVEVQGIIACGTCDLPAKELFLNMYQYNGRFGYQFCVLEGCTIDHRVRIYPFEENLCLRNETDVVLCVEQALDTRKFVE